ncbi:LPXTG-domain-containing protein cell wall anchor domain [Bacillus cereus BAG2O-3]|nr:LPXTG-domain-containing protein cell wall anchor domain [Bacillus cereus BAG2O-3]
MRKSFNQKIKKLSSSFIVLLLVCTNFLIHLPYKAEAATTELKGLGDVSYYNAIIFGDHSATSADIEGAMAIQKNMNASSYTVLAAATGAHNLAGATWVEEGYPALLLGGQFTKAGTGQVIIQDGTVAMTKDGDPEGAMKSSYDRISYKEQAEIDAKFKEFRKDVDSVIEDAGQLHTDKPKPGMTFGIGEDVNNPNIYVSSGQNGEKTFNVSDVYLPNVSNKDFMVIYSDAEEVNFGGGAILYDTTDKGGFTLVNTSQTYDPNSFFTELASKVIWAFPNATKITTKGYGVVGSVFAPNAVVDTKGGSINGQAFVGGLHQRDGFEVHNFKFNWPKWNKPSVEKVTGQFEIVKVDASDETKLLPGAEFEVYKDGKQIDTLRTDKTGKVISKKLEPGKYTLKETKAPEGYKLLKEEIEVTVEENKVVPVIVKNVKALGSLQVVKKDAESKNVLKGAEFRLKNENGQIVGGAKTTNKDGVVTFENLVPGKYTLEETKAPEGYKAIEVTVEVNVVANKVAKREVLNEKMKEEITGQLEITKVDANDTGKTLAGAVFEIWKDGSKIDTLTTNKNGKAISKKLEPGDYILKEVHAPEGYKLSDKETKFKISNEKVEVKNLEITNEKEQDKGPEKPGEETEKPGEGTEKPGEETEKPGEETEKPGEETEKPGEETEKPGEETEKPGEETEKPGEETEKPGEGTEKPGEGTEKPGEGTEKPGGETEKPGEEIEKPGEETEKPGGETEKPGEETEKPGEEIEKPGEETEKPGEETEKPGEETEKPGGETEKPGGETEKPGEGTEKPGEEIEKPGEETEKPGGGTEKPGEGTEKPGGETEKPGEGTEKPGGETEKPGGETEKPGEGTEKPGGETEKPGEGTEKPGEGIQKPSQGTETSSEEVGKPNLPEKEQGSSNDQKLPATGHNTNYLPFIGVILVLLGIRLRFMTKNS